MGHFFDTLYITFAAAYRPCLIALPRRLRSRNFIKAHIAIRELLDDDRLTIYMLFYAAADAAKYHNVLVFPAMATQCRRRAAPRTSSPSPTII